MTQDAQNLQGTDQPIDQAFIEKMASSVHQAEQTEQLEALRIQLFGKSGVFTSALKQLGHMAPDERKVRGKQINHARQKIAQLLKQKKHALEAIQLNQRLLAEQIDVTLPGLTNRAGSLHPITTITNKITAIFVALGYRVAEGPEIENDYYNFSALNIPEHHPARTMQDTFYLADPHADLLLRTHTSPVQIRAMLQQKPPLAIVCPGKTYRCDSDVTHTPMFHQVEVLCIDRDLGFPDLKGTITHFLQKFFTQDIKVRMRPSYFPFTEPSAEVDIRCISCNGKGCRICSHTGWLEVMGCGMVHPNVLREVHIQPHQYSGFAFGMGVERLTMLYHQVNDIRMFFENDLDFLSQYK